MLPLPFPAASISLPYGAVDGKFYTASSPHQGTDFSSRSRGVVAGSVIRASGSGVVIRQGVGPAGVTPTMARPNSLSGNSIDVDYGTTITRYMHRPFDSPTVPTGTRVVEGTAIGVIGATGLVDAAHLHMETWDKRTGRRVNPAVFFDFARTVTTSAAAGGNAAPFEEDDMFNDQDRANLVSVMLALGAGGLNPANEPTTQTAVRLVQGIDKQVNGLPDALKAIMSQVNGAPEILAQIKVSADQAAKGAGGVVDVAGLAKAIVDAGVGPAVASELAKRLAG